MLLACCGCAHGSSEVVTDRVNNMVLQKQVEKTESKTVTIKTDAKHGTSEDEQVQGVAGDSAGCDAGGGAEVDSDADADDAAEVASTKDQEKDKNTEKSSGVWTGQDQKACEDCLVKHDEVREQISFPGQKLCMKAREKSLLGCGVEDIPPRAELMQCAKQSCESDCVENYKKLKYKLGVVSGNKGLAYLSMKVENCKQLECPTKAVQVVQADLDCELNAACPSLYDDQKPEPSAGACIQCERLHHICKDWKHRKGAVDKHAEEVQEQEAQGCRRELARPGRRGRPPQRGCSGPVSPTLHSDRQRPVCPNQARRAGTARCAAGLT